MGRLTVKQMSSEVSLNLQGQVPDPDRLLMWLNFGLLDLASYIKLPMLRVIEDFPFTEGDTEYLKPDNYIAVVEIKVNKKRLAMSRRLPITEDVDQDVGPPKYWIEREGNIVIWPPPDQDYTDGTIEFIREPLPLALPVDVTEFPAYWDAGVIMLGTYHGWISLGNQEKATTQWNLFRDYARNRITERDFQQDATREGIRVITSFEELRENEPRYRDR